METRMPWLSVFGNHVRFEVDLPDIPVYQILNDSVAKYPDHAALSYRSQKTTYRELGAQVVRFASALARSGVRKGDRVAIMVPNSPQFVVAYYGVLTAGGIVVQINTMYTERELLSIVADSGAETIVVAEGQYPVAKAVMPRTGLKWAIVVSEHAGESDFAPDWTYDAFIATGTEHVEPAVIDPAEDIAVLQYTGGTTGRSKGVMLTHRNLVVNLIQFDQFMMGSLGRGTERILTALPLFHVYGMTVCMNLSIFVGGCCVLVPRFEVSDVLNTIKRERPTIFPGAPTMYLALLGHPEADQYGIDSIRMCFSGSAPMPVDRLKEFERRTGAKIYEGYGLSEASPTTHFNPLFGERKPGSIGIGYCATEYKIVDIGTGLEEQPFGSVGELILKGPQVMKGYWNMPEETAVALRDGWLYTGDIARMDEEGYVYIVDRKKDVIIASGYNVYPREVEEVLYEHPAVQEAVVVGTADAYRGETVKAVVVLKEGVQASEEDIIAFCRKHMAVYKVPRIVEFRAQLPKSGAGKILRRMLRDDA